MLNWWHAVPFSCAGLGAALLFMAMLCMPNVMEGSLLDTIEEERRRKLWGYVVCILAVAGFGLLMAAGPMMWLPIWYG